MCVGGVGVEKEVRVKPLFNDQNPVRHGELREIIRLTALEILFLFPPEAKPRDMRSRAEDIADAVIDQIYRK